MDGRTVGEYDDVRPLWVNGAFPDEPFGRTLASFHAVPVHPHAALRYALDWLWLNRCIRKGWLTRQQDEQHTYFVTPRYTVERSDGIALSDEHLEALLVVDCQLGRETFFTLTRADNGE